MKFHEYKTFLWEEMRTRFPRHVTEEGFYAVAMAARCPRSACTKERGASEVLAGVPTGFGSEQVASSTDGGEPK